MTEKTNEKQLFKDLIRQILWEDWDPIGVYDPDPKCPWNDEYDIYVPQIYKMVVDGHGYLEISAVLE